MSAYYQKKVKKRTLLLSSLLMLWLAVIVFRLIQLQVIDHSRLKAEVLEQNQNTTITKTKRGTVYDRYGAILARSVPRQSVFLKSFKGESTDSQLKTLEALRRTLHLPAKDVTRIKARIKKNDPFIWIMRKIESETADKVMALGLDGIYTMEESKRFYPHGKRAAHILGRVNIDSEGASGIEYRYNSLLEGEKGKRLTLRDAKRRRYYFETIKEPIPGKDLVLTLDETIQYIAESELQEAVHQHQASWGTVIVAYPPTGEILAMANCPAYSLNDSAVSPSKIDRNKAIHHTFDPGSTFKIVTASAALETKSVSLNDSFDCSGGSVYVAGKTIRDHHRFEVLTFPEVIIHSSNVGAILVGEKTGEENLFNTIKKFGFGQRTGIDLPAEERGLFQPLKSWTKISCASHSIGYEISVTPLQMLQVLNIIVNRGLATPPKIVKTILHSADDAEKIPVLFNRVISEQTALLLCSILQQAVTKGTGQAAQIPGYTVIGKTGTAQKLDSQTHQYSGSAHTASFVGCVLKDTPIFSVIVVLDHPKGLYYGGQVAAPLFQKIASRILFYLGIPPDRKSEESFMTARFQKGSGE